MRERASEGASACVHRHMASIPGTVRGQVLSLPVDFFYIVE